MGAKMTRIGVVGCGGFAQYALERMQEVPGISVVAMTEPNPEVARVAAEKFSLPGSLSVEELVAMEEVDLVYLGTPPFLHYPHAMLALEQGKHVICEKPLSMTVAQADEMIAVAREKNLVLIANLMQRYSPVFGQIKRLIDSQVLGEFLHGYFENYATDEGLLANHWFWDLQKSGGIFIEHAVHFFDLFSGWLGEGTVESAQLCKRPGTDIEEQVQCVVRYENGGLVNFYHGFTQVGRMDRQEMRLLFERGDVTLYEWVPTVVEIRALANDETVAALRDIFPTGQVAVTETYEGAACKCLGRHKALEVTQRIEMRDGVEVDKMARYGELLQAMITDQVTWIKDASHVRVTTEVNGRESVAMAEVADKLAHGKF